MYTSQTHLNICIHIYTYIYMYMYICTHTPHTQKHLNIFVHIYTSWQHVTCSNLRQSIYIYIFIYIFIYIYHTHIHIYIYIYIYIYMYMYTYTSRIYTYTFAYKIYTSCHRPLLQKSPTKQTSSWKEQVSVLLYEYIYIYICVKQYADLRVVSVLLLWGIAFTMYTQVVS